MLKAAVIFVLMWEQTADVGMSGNVYPRETIHTEALDTYDTLKACQVGIEQRIEAKRQSAECRMAEVWCAMPPGAMWCEAH
jgi:hypothetical protein